MRAYLFVVVLLLVIFGSIAGYLYNKFSVLAGTDFTPPPITIGAATAQSAVWPSELETVGTIRAARGVELSAETSGEVIEISVESGEQVTAGQPILTLNNSIEKATRKQREADLKLARQLFERDASLIKQKSIPQSQYDRSQAELDSAAAQLARTSAQLENKRIVAPFTGTTGIIRVKVGDYIESGTAITNLQDLSELEIDFSVPDRYFPSLRPGLSIAVHVSAFPERVFKATLTAIDAKVDEVLDELDETKARALANEVDAMLWDEVFSLALFQSPGNVAVRSDLANFGPAGLGDLNYSAIGFMK